MGVPTVTIGALVVAVLSARARVAVDRVVGRRDKLVGGEAGSCDAEVDLDVGSKDVDNGLRDEANARASAKPKSAFEAGEEVRGELSCSERGARCATLARKTEWGLEFPQRSLCFLL